MRGPATTLSRVLSSGGPLAVVVYRDLPKRQELLSLVLDLLLPRQALVTSELGDLFGKRDEPLVFLPDDEAEAVSELAARRDQLIDRTLPAIVFLLRGGDGFAALAEEPAAGLASWLHGRIVDPEELEEIDADFERQLFEEDAGVSPEEWLRRAEAGAIDDTFANNVLTSRARLLGNSG